MLKLPRAPGGVPQVVLDPKVYNDMADAVERFDALADQIQQVLNISAAPPLAVSHDRNGIRLSMKRDRWRLTPVKTGSGGTPLGSARYQVTVGRWKEEVDWATVGGTSTFDWSAVTDFTSSYTAVLLNAFETGSGILHIPPDTIIPALYLGAFTSSPAAYAGDVFVVMVNHAVRDVRQNPLTLDFEKTFKNSDDATPLADADWDVWATAQRCTTTPTATLMQLMNPGSYT
jgi:hypothetical protein